MDGRKSIPAEQLVSLARLRRLRTTTRSGAARATSTGATNLAPTVLSPERIVRQNTVRRPRRQSQHGLSGRHRKRCLGHPVSPWPFRVGRSSARRAGGVECKRLVERGPWGPACLLLRSVNGRAAVRPRPDSGALQARLGPRRASGQDRLERGARHEGEGRPSQGGGEASTGRRHPRARSRRRSFATPTSRRPDQRQRRERQDRPPRRGRAAGDDQGPGEA